MIHEIGNIELSEILDTEPTTQCKVCLSHWDIDIVYCTCGHFMRTRAEENKTFVQYTMDLLSIPNYYTKDDPMGTVTGRSQGTESTTSPIRSTRSAKNTATWVSTTDSYETKSSERTWLTTFEPKKNLSPNGWPCGRRPHPPFNSTRNWKY